MKSVSSRLRRKKRRCDVAKLGYKPLFPTLRALPSRVQQRQPQTSVDRPLASDSIWSMSIRIAATCQEETPAAPETKSHKRARPLWLGIWLGSDSLAGAQHKAQQAKASHEHCVGFRFRNGWNGWWEANGDDLPMVIDSSGNR